MDRALDVRWIGIVCLGLAALLYAALQVTLEPRPASIRVRWAPQVDDAMREAGERRYSLTEGLVSEGQTWGLSRH